MKRTRRPNKNQTEIKGGVVYRYNRIVTDCFSIEGNPERWQALLAEIRSFYFDGNMGTFTARREKRRQGYFWYAYRTFEKRLYKAYLGKAEDMSLSRLHEAARELEKRFRAYLITQREADKK